MRLTKIVKQHELRKHICSQHKTKYNNTTEKYEVHILREQDNTVNISYPVSFHETLLKYEIRKNKLTS